MSIAYSRRRSPRSRRSLAIVALLIAALCAPVALAGAVGRDDEPIVLTGADLSSLQGVAPGEIVAFRFNGGGWRQVPVQVDERVTVDYAIIFNLPPEGVTGLVYADAETWTGGDSNPTFDADDELVLRADDVDQRAGSGNPSGVNGSTRVELRVDNPLNGSTGYLYLFVRSGSLDPSAGAADINYQFVLTSGDYKTTYNVGDGVYNPETSSVTTAAYRVGFSDRWIRDDTRVAAGSSSNVDIIESNKSQFAPQACGRSEDSFSAGPGAMIANKTGPVRAIRSYIGANSGPHTTRTHWFYPEREVVRSDLRVHRIAGIMDYIDFNIAAVGMTYYNDLNTQGVTIDGNPDSVNLGPIQWELVSGSQGTWGTTWRLETDLPDPSYNSYYSDTTSPTNLCDQWDTVEYGASGVYRDTSIPTTNPEVEGHNVWAAIRSMKYGAPNQGIAFAQELWQEQQNPLTVDVSTGGGGGTTCPDGDNDGYAVCDGSCTPDTGDQCGDCNDGNNAINPGVADGCDGVDNDCNATTADGSAEAWFGQVCDGADSDLCTEGNFTCTAGAQQCSDTTGDDVDVCDGADNDCDPATADGSAEAWFGQACDGADSDLCAEGNFTCTAGAQQCSDNTSDTLEVCDNSVDDDCDGAIDAADNECAVPDAPSGLRPQ